MPVLKAVPVTGDGQVVTGKGWYWGCRVTGDGTNPARALLYDNTAASGTVLDELAATATGPSAGEMFSNPVRFDNGIFADVTTPGRVVVWVEN